MLKVLDDLSKSFKAKYYCVYYGFSVIITHYIIEMLGGIVNNVVIML